MSRPAPLDTAELPLPDAFDTSSAVRHRRLVSSRVRRRRLLLADIALGAALGLIGLAIAPGLAIAALGALIVLAGCGAALAAETLRRRRRDRARSPREM
jgi:hypothetical protein